MSIAWYARRLASMSAAEIAHRVMEQGKRALSRRRTFGWSAFAVGEGPLPVLPGLRDAVLRHATPDLAAAVAAAAAALKAGRFAALGVAWPERDPDALFPPGVWRLDPVTSRAWPGAERFCFDIAYRHERNLGDVKYVWEFNRLQHLQPLAAAVALHGDAAALAALEAAIASWHGANPPFRGIAWNSGIELAMRAVSLLVVASLCGEALSAGSGARIRAMLAAHLYWLRRYPSGFSSANNHLVAEATAEFLIATAMPELSASGAVRAASRAVLEREAGLQILADGAPAEQSPTYGAFTAEMLLLAAATARRSGHPLAGAVDERLAAFARFVLTLASPDGTVPAIGDDDEGRVVTLAHAREDAYPASVAAAIGGFLGQPGLGPAAPYPELRDAVFGARGRGGTAPQGLTTFPAGGLTVVREVRAGRDLTVVLDHGPLGYLAIAAHGHADANALILSVDGAPVLVDPGTYLYHSGGRWRDWFRGTRAHNTVTLGGADQSTISGPFNWSHKARAALDHARPGPNWSVLGRHDGYRGRFGTDHLRLVEARPEGLSITDRLDPAPRQAVAAEIVFQFAPAISLIREGTSWRAERNGAPILTLAIEAPGEVSVAAGGADAAGGWVSPAFGQKIAAPRLVWRGSMGASGIRTRLVLAPAVP
ncbi:alginate lyase family protein [Methylobacterium sp. JK268]